MEKLLFSGTLLTIVWLMQALDPMQHHCEVLQYIEKLLEVDPMRKQYYRDLSKYFQNSLQQSE